MHVLIVRLLVRNSASGEQSRAQSATDNGVPVRHRFAEGQERHVAVHMLCGRFRLREVQGCDAAQAEGRATREGTRESRAVLVGTLQSRAQADQASGGQISQRISRRFSAFVVELQGSLEHAGHITGIFIRFFKYFIGLFFLHT